MIRVIREGKKIKVNLDGGWLKIKRLTAEDLEHSKQIVREWVDNNPDKDIDEVLIQEQYKWMLRCSVSELGPQFVDELGNKFKLDKDEDGRVTEDCINNLIYGCGLKDDFILIAAHLTKGIPSKYISGIDGEVIKGIEFDLGEPKKGK